MTFSSAPVTDDRDLAQIHFAEGLPGFPDHREFVLVRWGDDESPFSLLRSTDDEVAFVVVPPAIFFPDYAPVIDDETADVIGAQRAEDVLLLVIVTVREPIDRSTANLLGPVLVNLTTLRGVQAVLDPDSYSSSTPLIAAN